MHKLSRGTGTGEGVGQGGCKAGHCREGAFTGGAGQRAVREQCPLGRERERVSLQVDAGVCRAGQFQAVSVVG